MKYTITINIDIDTITAIEKIADTIGFDTMEKTINYAVQQAATLGKQSTAGMRNPKIYDIDEDAERKLRKMCEAEAQIYWGNETGRIVSKAIHELHNSRPPV